jgi:hypothetical protein
MFVKTPIRLAAKLAAYKWKFIGNHIIIGAVGVFRCDTKASVGGIQIAGTGHVLKIAGVATVISSAGSGRRTGPIPPPEAITGAQKPHFAVGVMRLCVAPRPVNRKSIRRIADKCHLAPTIERTDKFGRNAVVMIGTVVLHMGMARVKAQVTKAGQQCFIPD